MRLERIVARNIGPFRGEHVIDLTGLGSARIIAIVGPNGGGKSTTLELWPGSMFRKCPTRGSLQSLALARDSYVETVVENGARYRIRQTCDVVTGKGESYVFDADGAAVVESGKRHAFDAWAKKHLPVPEVFYASQFSAQGSDGLVSYDPADRKDVLLRTIGIDRLDVLAEGARKHREAASGQAETLRARIADERERCSDVSKLQAELDTAIGMAVEAEATLGRARTEHTAAVAAEAETKRLAGEAERVSATRRGIEANLEARGKKLADIETRVRNNQDVIARAEEIRTAVERVAELDAEVQALDEESRRAKEKVSGLESRLQESRRRADEIEERIQAARDVLERAEEIRGAVERIRSLDAAIANGQVRYQECIGKATACRADAEQHGRAAALHESAARDAAGRVEAAESRLRDRERVAAAVATLPELEAELQAAEAAERGATEALEQLQGQRISCADERISFLQGGLCEIRDVDETISQAKATARDRLSEDDAGAARARKLPEELSAAQSAVRLARVKLSRLTERVSRTRTLAAQAPAIEAAETDLMDATDAAEKAREAAAQERRDAAAASEAAVEWDASADLAMDGVDAAAAARRTLEPVAALLDQLAQAEGRVEEVAPQGNALRSEIAALEGELAGAAEAAQGHRRVEAAAERARLVPVAALADRLAQAKVRVEELAPQGDALRSEIAALEGELAATPAIVVPPTTFDVREALAVLEGSERAARDVHAQVIALEQKVDQAQASQRKLEELEADLAVIEAHLADWTRLAADLGRDGVQAMEIDAAGPLLTDLANELLTTCFGSRFSVRLDTVRSSKDGKKQIEGCEITVIDTVRGREAPAKTLSGGELVIVSEALSLALTVMACRRAGVERPTLVRDESGAALNNHFEKNGEAYVAMLRKAADMIGADRVLFVTHDPQLWDLADAKIEVGVTAQN